MADSGSALPRPINLTDKFAGITQPWSPRIVAELNGQQVRLAKVAGSFVWHSHAQEDELFLVVGGQLRMDFREGSVLLNAGELIVVPRGVEHRPHADAEAEVLLFEPASTVNTGDLRDRHTIEELEWI